MSIWPRYSSSATAPVRSRIGNAQRPDEPDVRGGDRGGPQRREPRPWQDRGERVERLGERRRVQVGADHVRVRLRVAHARPRGPVRVHVEHPRRPRVAPEQAQRHEHGRDDDEQVQAEPVADARLDGLGQAGEQPVDRARVIAEMVGRLDDGSRGVQGSGVSTARVQNVLIVLSGLPGTGKSAIADGVGGVLRLPVLSVDPIESSIVRSGVERSFETGLAAYVVAETLADRNLALDIPTVIDAVNSVDEARDMGECSPRSTARAS